MQLNIKPLLVFHSDHYDSIPVQMELSQKVTVLLKRNNGADFFLLSQDYLLCVSECNMTKNNMTRCSKISPYTP